VFRLLFKQIDKLPERCREIFLLHLEGNDNETIAKKLSLSIETVKTQKKRAMKTLRDNLKEELPKKYPDISFFLLFLYLDLSI
ncbi:RNA polymerase sigma factor, partial [Bacteroides xylanisolvens]